jgi:hypothetical protein
MEILYKIITFGFIFSTLAIIKLVVEFLRAIYSNPPKKFEISNTTTIIYGIFISYIITYLINL